MWRQENRNAPYGNYTCRISYAMDSGDLQIPVCGPDGSECEIVSVQAPCGTKTVAWSVTRTGDKPRIPSPKPSNPNDRLISMTVSPFTDTLTANGVKEYRIEGVYIYACRLPYNETTDMPMGKPPYSDENANENAVKPIDYDDSIIAPSPQPVPNFASIS